MEWTDEAILLSARPHGETASVVELLTRAHGRHAGLVHGGRSRRLRPVLQTGNHVDAEWRARLADQLGFFRLEPRRTYAAEAMDDPLALTGLQALAAMARLLPERDPHPALFEIALFVLAYLGDRSVWPALLARFELALLDELGFGLDLKSCAATGSTEDLAYVSPKSGRAVSRAAGEPYRERLLRLPPLLLGRGPTVKGDIGDAFLLTGTFLERHVLVPRGLASPEVRARLVAMLADWPEVPSKGALG
ncbi:MAG: DNA repair protein RecO [Hyphomicrobiaceae bacterium]